MNKQSFKHAFTISMIYLVFGLLWIYFSDALVATITSNNQQLTLLQTYKGWFFIIFTTIILFILSNRFFYNEFVAFSRHLEKQQAVQEELLKKDMLLKTIINSSPDAIFAKDLEGKYLLFNSGASNIVNIPADKIIGNGDEVIFSSETAQKIRKKDSEIVTNGVIESHDEELTIANGEQKYFYVTKGPLRDSNGDIFGLFGISHDITERIEYERTILENKEKFDRLAHLDPLTGLPNRLSLIETLNAKVTDSSPFSLLFLDLDDFQQINDSYGHRFGDKLLIEVAHLLQRIFPPEAYIVRTGGDEFVVIMEHDKDHSSHFSLLNHLIDNLSHPINIDGVDVYSTVSIGIADYPKDANSAENLLQCADAAMYKAKKMGKNTFYLYSTDLIQKALYRTTITSNLKKGLDNGDLKLHYQPQVDPYTDKIIGYEALLRWETAEGFISPALFIPICEESGLIQDVGKFVLLEGCKTAVLWEKTGILHGQIAINVSVRQLIHPDFLLTLDQIIEETKCPPFCIELEITESSILENPEKMISLLSIIKSKGFKISIDDFGTGYSSLSYLKHLPIDKLKIDISFIRNITMEPKNQTIVKTIIALAKGLGMEVLAEGVESIEERTFLRDNGIDSIQGYYYYKPMEKSSIVKLLQ
jgi:diguanylate cyclase (GGDEF)-like protein/PAS domain S-box-containing protein